MMSRIVYTPRAERRRRRFSISRGQLMVFGVIITGAFFITGIIFLLRWPKLQVSTVHVTGLSVLTEEEVTKDVFDSIQGSYFGFLPRRSVFLLSTAALQAKIKNDLPRIEEIAIKKAFPHTLKIVIEERKSFGILCAQSHCVYIDTAGFAYENAPDSSGSLIMKIKTDAGAPRVGDNALDKNLVNRLIFLRQEVKRTTGMEVIGYELLKKVPREIRVEVDEGFRLIFDRDDDFKNVFRVLKTVLEEEIKEKRSKLQYIDLRFGNKVFYK